MMKMKWFRVAVIVALTAVLAGCVTVEVTNTDPVTVIAGQRDVILLECNLNANQSATLESITVNVAITGDVVACLANPVLILDNQKVPVTNDPGQDLALGTDRNTGVITFVPVEPIGFTPGQVRQIRVFADLSSATQDGTLIQASTALIAGRPAIQEQQVFGPEITVGKLGRLSVVSDASTPSASMLSGQTSDNLVLVIRLRAADEDVWVKGLPFYAQKVNGGAWDQVGQITIWDSAGDALLGIAVPSAADDSPEKLIPIYGSNSMVVFNQPLLVPAASEKTVVIKVDTAPCAAWEGNNLGESGQGFRLYVPGEEIQAEGAGSGLQITPSGEVWSNKFYLFQSVPRVVPLELDNHLRAGWTSNQIIFSLAFLNLGPSDVVLGRLTFQVTTKSAISGNFRLLKEYQEEPVGRGEMDINGYVVVDLEPTAASDAIINPGDRLFLMADLWVDSQDPGASIATSLVLDTAFPEPLPDFWEQAVEQDCRLLWSDLTWSGPEWTRYDIYTWPQWSNGYLVENTDKEPTVLTK